MELRVGTRKSALARAQAEMIGDALVAEAESRGITLAVSYVPITSEGDTHGNSLVGQSGTGVFVTALRKALLFGECDLLVHSLKDVPTEPHREISIVAIPERADARDALCAQGKTLEELPVGATIGTGSPRRAAQLRALRDDLDVVDIRGNVDSRLQKVEDGELDAVVLAQAGLERLGRREESSYDFTIDQMVPAPGQGALALEMRLSADTEVVSLVEALDHAPTRAAVTAERAVMQVLEGGCSAPLGAYAVAEGELLTLYTRVINARGTLKLSDTSRGFVAEPYSLGRTAGLSLLGRGAGRLLTS